MAERTWVPKALLFRAVAQVVMLWLNVSQIL